MANDLNELPFIKPTLFQRAGDYLSRTFGTVFAERPPGESYDAGELPPTLDAQRKLLEGARISRLLPYESFDPKSRLYYNVDSVGFMLECSPAVGLDQSKLGILTGVITQGLRSHTAIQISLYADPDIHPILDRWLAAGSHAEGPCAAAVQALARRRVDYLRGGAWTSLFSDQSFLMRDYRMFVSFLRPRLPGAPIDSTEIEYLERTRAALRGTLASAGLVADEVRPDALIRLIDQLVNPTSQPRPPMRYDPELTLRQQMSDRDALLLVGRDAIGAVHDGDRFSLLPFSVRQYPEQWPGWLNGELLGSTMSNVLRLPCPLIITQTIYSGDQVNAISTAKMKSARATQMVDAPVGRFVPEWKARKADWDFVMGQVSGGDKLLKVHYQILAYTKLGDEELCEQRIKAMYAARGWSLQKDRFSAPQALRAALPMSAGPQLITELRRLGYLRSMVTWSVINTSPLMAEWKGTGSPLILYVGRKGQLQYFDPFDNSKGNFNIACAAAPGAGKSFATQELITRMLVTSGRVWVIDSGDSYLNLCSTYGGTYIKFDRKSRPVINLFYGIDPAFFDDDALPQIKQIMAKMASPDQALDSVHSSLLEQAIREAWHAHGERTEITEVWALLNTGVRREQKNLAVMLKPWTREGSNGRFFTGATNIDLNNRFVVLELGDLDARQDLQAVVLMILMLRVTELMYRSDRSQRKMCIIDEAWRLLGNGSGGDFIEAGYRTARKFGGSFCSVTQGINDYYESASAQAALACSDWVLLLRQKPEALAAAADNKRIFVDEQAQQLLLSVDTVQGKYSEIAIRGPIGGLSIGRLVVDPFTEKLYSTKGSEFQYIQDAVARGVSLEAAVEDLLKRSEQR